MANDKHFSKSKELLLTLAITVSKGGNILINVGPTKEGTIDVIMQERLTQLGQWLKINGEAVSHLFKTSGEFSSGEGRGLNSDKPNHQAP